MHLNTSAYEVNFDGLVGPTHNYAGLAHGNLASEKNKGKKSNPKKAALEGLAKMKFLADLGVKQAVLPPHEPPPPPNAPPPPASAPSASPEPINPFYNPPPNKPPPS